MVRKALSVMAISAPSATVQVVMLCWLAGLELLLTLWWMPFERVFAQRVQVFSLIVECVTLSGAVLFYGCAEGCWWSLVLSIGLVVLQALAVLGFLGGVLGEVMGFVGNRVKFSGWRRCTRFGRVSIFFSVAACGADAFVVPPPTTTCKNVRTNHLTESSCSGYYLVPV